MEDTDNVIEGELIGPEEAVRIRMEYTKKKLLEQLKKVPIVQVACERVDISRSTYYRWRSDDSSFAKAADEAIKDGVLLINDLAENQLLMMIRSFNITAIIFWLKNHHKSYKEKKTIIVSPKDEKPIMIVSWKDGQPVNDTDTGKEKKQ